MNLGRGHRARSAKTFFFGHERKEKNLFPAFLVNLRRGHGARSAKNFFFPAFPVNLRRGHEREAQNNFFGHEREKNFSLLSL